MPFTKTFTGAEDFAALHAAQKWLTDHGFSYGALERGSPIAIWEGDCIISKWRGLSEDERAECHGTITAPGMTYRTGPVTVTLRDEYAPAVEA